MGVPESWIRQDEKAGSVDLALLAEPMGSWDRPKSMSFRTRTGLWYKLSPMDESEEHTATALQRDDTLYPVKLEFDPVARISGNMLEEVGLGLLYIKKWVTERRHFRVGAISLLNTVISEGDRLTIEGRQTGPIDVAWVTERVNPASDVEPHMGSGLKLPSGVWNMEYTRTVANF